MVTLVIPCYNEAQRLPKQSFLQALQDQPDLHFMMVNDGSRDATLRMLEQLQQANPDRIGVLDLVQNVGKAEAVRQGLLAALAKVAGNMEQGFIGYWDADLATPLAELPRFMEVMDSKPQVQWVMGTRIKMLGWDVDRTMHRHYVGRVFATFGRLVPGLPGV
ncbi:MAG: glycosyltransferase [Phycisphaerales bacterium]|nr:glycosyltransferase [Phycisphaerales bacterium]